jgi:hypothetical protein
MNDQLQQALAQILGKTMNAVESGAAFLQAELPEVVSQLLMWKLVESIVVAVSMLLLVAGAARFVYLAATAQDRKKPWREQHSRGDFWTAFAGIGTVISVVVLLVCVPLMIMHAMNAIQIAVAPKVYLIEYAARLAK